MITVPLEVISLQDDGFHLLVEVVVFGHTFKAVLDTGASRTVLDKQQITELAQEEHLLVLSDKLSTGLGTTTMESFTITLPDFRIGSLELTNFETAVIDLSTINYAYTNLEFEPVIGVIGGDILMKHRAVINYAGQTLRLEI
ncbi:clan AA aspartic protease [Pedobacter sp. BS3]|uniref:retropepsin-like aspartic protease n=1 Tax=Pedobacter sp. BS3 TaxID=2567937 RepID=UPI0011ED5E82|nr:retropepsin-like aspartic protease [Pedobacter sp. BS3]TZF81050.1 clan AA aspartic protease [Pedobacter sp. BS3]